MAENKIIIPWFGYDSHHNAWGWSIEEDLEATIDKSVHRADECIESITTKKHQLIIISDVIAAGELKLPEYIGLSEYPAISCHVIQQIKSSELNKDTPVIAAIIPLGKYVMPEKYRKAGADVVFDLTMKNSASNFVSVVGKYLKK